MFTGIIENLGQIKKIITSGTNIDFVIQSPISSELSIDQSVAHNGVCLTVIDVSKNTHRVTAIQETIKKSNLKYTLLDDYVNMERSMKINDRLDGHIVQGHVDTIAKLLSIEKQNGSWVFSFKLHDKGLLVEKGSICVNGVSLTCFNVKKELFSVAIIPYTHQHTNLGKIQSGMFVNIEFDILGKYVKQLLKPSHDIS